MLRLFSLSLCSLCLCGSVHTLAAEQPNVVLIVIDDLGQRDLGCYGSTFYQTPNIDKMAKDGLRFTDFYAACPVCSPTRASIMTGKYPQRVNITDWIPGREDMPDQRMKRPAIRNELPLEEVTIAEALKKRGYVTALIGKWHLGGSRLRAGEAGLRREHRRRPDRHAAQLLRPVREQDRGRCRGLEKAEEGEYLTDRLAAEAEKFIEENKDKPFFLYLPHYARSHAADARSRASSTSTR